MAVDLPALAPERFAAEIARLSPEALPDGVLAALFAHYEELRRWSPRLALIGPGTAGEALTRHFGESLAALPLLRPEQIFARIGGEEFAVLCPETDLDGATVLAGKLRELFEAAPFECGTATVGITCSFGVAGVGAEMRRLDDLIEAADRALYRAKNGGRNRVEIETPGAGRAESTDPD